MGLCLVFTLLTLSLDYGDDRVHRLPFLPCDKPVTDVTVWQL